MKRSMADFHSSSNASEPGLSTPILKLTQTEEVLFQKILDACDKLGLKTTVRVAGGWVRDKLLGLPSDDIDLALDDMMGEEFAVKLNDYFKLLGTGYRTVGVIKSNPVRLCISPPAKSKDQAFFSSQQDQSKHLETATFKIDGMDIDVTNLRTESYSSGSRIPEMKLGTPLEDVLRRDFTVNALFYNIREKRVEDFCKNGLSDMSLGIIRTPTDPFTTFSDDPLRVLRAARFAGRLGYRVHDDVIAAASSQAIHNHLASKVSRERFGIEVSKMIAAAPSSSGGGRALHSLTLLCQWGLRPIIFACPSSFQSVSPQQDGNPAAALADAHYVAICRKEIGLPTPEISPQAEQGELKEIAELTKECLARVAAAAEVVANQVNIDKDLKTKFLYAAFLSPFYGYEYFIKKTRKAPIIQYILRESLKLPIKFSAGVYSLVHAAHCLGLIGDAFVSQSSGGSSLAKADQEMLLKAGSWVMVLKETWKLGTKLSTIVWRNHKRKKSPRALENWIEKESGWVADLPVWRWKPFFGGGELTKLLAIKGPLLGAAIREQSNWRMLQPEGSKEACLEHLRGCFKQT